jgi:hypothetical protein
VLLHTTIIGAAAVTLSTSYAFGDFFGMKHSLHRGFRDAKGVYLSFAAQAEPPPLTREERASCGWLG